MSRPARRRRRAPIRWKPRRSGPRPLRRLAAGLLVLVTLVLAWTAWSSFGPGPGSPKAAPVSVVLPRGSGVSEIGARLEKARVIRSQSAFVLMARLTGAAAELKAGEYEFRRGVTLGRVLDDIRAGRVVIHLVTVPEGWTSAMAAEAVDRSPVLKGVAAVPPEGSLLPETYRVERGETRAATLQRMTKAQDDLVAELWPKRQAGLPVNTPQEAITLASIVEKETGIAAERPRIAAVFVNRLRAGMRLESDPTIIYGITGGKPIGRRILLSEITAKTPYNTYVIDGLPPTPIANPGKDAIAAVLNPPKTTELFFVADGKGGHVFASTFEAHKANVARFREYQRNAGLR